MKIIFTLISILSLSISAISQIDIPKSGSNHLTTCSTTVYDMKGTTPGLPANADGYLTIYPSTPGSVIAVYIEELDIDFYLDTFYVYNGATTSSPLLNKCYGYHTGTGQEYYGTSGPVTIRLKTGKYSSESNNGCIIKVRCAPTVQHNNMLKNKLRYVNSCNTTIYDQGGVFGDYENNSSDSIRILPNGPNKRVQMAIELLSINSRSSDQGQDFLSFKWGLKPSSTYIRAGYEVPDKPVALSSGSPDGSIDFYLVSRDIYTAQGLRAKISCITDANVTPITETVLPSTGSSDVGCGVKVFDNGHKYNYLPNTDGSMTITPLTGKKSQIDFSEFDLGTGDLLTVYDGTTTAAPILYTLSGTTMPSAITASQINTSGALTARFVSNGTSERKGFIFNTSCATILGLNETESITSDNLVLYPNPASDEIVLEGLSKGCKLTVSDSNGKIILKKDLNEFKDIISINSWSLGLYHFTIENDKSEHTFPVSVIK